MKNYRLLFLLFIATIAGQRAFALRSYSFSTGSEAYSNLTGAQVIPGSDFDSNNMYFVSGVNGETFRFYDVDFPFGGLKSMAMEPYGTIRIDNDSSLIIIDAAFTYMDSIDANSSVSFRIDGTPGNYIVKGEWKNQKLRVGQAGNFVNVQIWVYQQTGVVELHYGPRSANNASGYSTTNGPQIGMFYSKDDFTGCYEKLWVRGTPVNPILDSAANYNFFAMSGVPDSGTVYRFTPLFSTTGIANPSFTIDAPLFPNPVTEGFLHVGHADDYTITDVAGRCVLKFHNEMLLNVSILPDGIYFLHSANSRARKFVIAGN